MLHSDTAAAVAAAFGIITLLKSFCCRPLIIGRTVYDIDLPAGLATWLYLAQVG